MSEEIKSFILKKTSAGEICTAVSPMSNPNITRNIVLTERTPQVVLPTDWALGFIMDQGNYALYKKHYVTFDNNDALAKLAVENGVWFETLEFTPAKSTQAEEILKILKTGNRVSIMNAVKTYGKDIVVEVANHKVDELTTSVVSLLESLLNIQLIID